MGYIIAIFFLPFGIYTLSGDFSSIKGWALLVIGIFSLALAINGSSKEQTGKGDGYRSGTADYTNGGDSGGGD